MKTNYIGHDRLYQEWKQAGSRPGWHTAADLADNLARLDQIRQWPAFPPGGRLLELGCGAGNLSIHLAQAGYSVMGIDIAPTAIAWAAENAVQAGVAAEFQVGDVRDLAAVADESVDLVLDGNCLHCIIGADRVPFLASAWRVLRADGILCVQTMCDNAPDRSITGAEFDPESRCLIAEGIAQRYIGRSNDILGEIMAAGFKLWQMQVYPAADPRRDQAHLVLLAGKVGTAATRTAVLGGL